MKTIAAQLEKAYPETNKGETIVVTPLLENLVGKYRTNLGLLLGAVGLVLLIACANLANLFAARGAARSREFAIRAAVGASTRTDCETAFSRKFRRRDCRRSARIFHRRFGPVTRCRSWRHKVPPGFRTSHSTCRCLIFTLVIASVNSHAFWRLAGMAKFAGRRSAGFESRFARKRRCAISQADARLARH